MSEDERRDVIRKINDLLEDTNDKDLMEVYWYLKVFIV